MTEANYDLVIVGGGPAGQAAALALEGTGLAMAVVDEQLRPGGQILRQPPAAFNVANWLPGGTYGELKRQLARFEAASGIDWLGGRAVIGVARTDHGFAIELGRAGGASRVVARRLLLAAGCQDLAVPLPGWTLPGVYAAGGLQAFLKSQQFLPGDRIVLAGTHPLQLLIADQIVRAGGEVSAVLFAQPLSGALGALLRRPAAAVRHASELLAAATAYANLRKAQVPVHFGARLDAIEGDDRVQSVRCGNDPIACDAVGLCFGFVPQSALPRMIGARVRPAGAAGGWAVQHDAWMQTSVQGVFAAGETTGVAGAPAAMAAGTIAGVGIGLDLSLFDRSEAQRRAARARARHAKRLAFAELLDAIADPAGHFPALQPETIVCRCEDVPFTEVANGLATAHSANAVKLITRCGMGACQGRNCEPTLLRLLEARGGAGDPGFTSRFPARPVPIADLVEPD